MRSRKASLCRRQRAVTRLEVIVILSVIVLCAALLPMTFLRRTELQRRGVCIQNLSLIGTALYTYSDDNRDMFPIAAHPAATKDRIGNVEYGRQIGAYRGRWTDPQAGNTDRMPVPPDHLSTTRNLWTLFRLGLITRDKFICPSTRDVANQEPKAERYWDFGVDDVEGPVTAEQSRAGASQVSYGYQMPYGKQGQPNVGYDKPGVVADKGPFGAWLETGSAPPPAVFPAAADDARRWQPWNSPNHGSEGQNVLGAAWSNFQTKPTAGWASDNIYTQLGDAPSGTPAAWAAGQRGKGPALGARLAPAPFYPTSAHFAYDTLIYP